MLTSRGSWGSVALQTVDAGPPIMTSSAYHWVKREFADVDLGDARLDRRFRSIMVDLSRRCGKSIASSFDRWATIKAAYRFFDNARVQPELMLAPHIQQTAERVRASRESTVLFLQDTVYLDYGRRPATRGLDKVARAGSGTATEGLMLHNTLVTTVSGLPLGLADQRFIDRKHFLGPEKNLSGTRRVDLPVEQRESCRWIDVVRQCAVLDTGTARRVHVCDREADFYELFRDAAALGEHVLVRASRNRSIDKARRRDAPSAWLFDTLEAEPECGRTTVSIQVNGKRKYRTAELSIAYRTISMPPPPNRSVARHGADLPMVSLNAIIAVERDAPRGIEPLCWILLTSLEVADADSAIEKVRWYSTRWNVEVFHKVLKSGCAVEKAQLGDADRLKNYVTVKSLVAWRLFWLARMREHSPDAPCDTVLDRTEWVLLYRKTHKTKTVPKETPSLADALLWIAKLGGYIGRASDPDPGVISQWRGWERLMDIVDDHRDICG